MSLPTDGQQAGKLAGSQLLSSADLGLLSTLAASGSSTSTPFSTAIPATVIMLGQTASGNVTCVINTGASSGVLTQAASGTFGSSGITAVAANTTTTNLFVGVTLTGSNLNGPITFNNQTLTGLVVYGMTKGENWHSVSSGFQGAASTKRGDGSGVISLGPQ